MQPKPSVIPKTRPCPSPEVSGGGAGRRGAFESFVILGVCCILGQAEEPGRPFSIEVVDAATGHGVPLVELRTTHEVRFYTDSKGLVAILDPDLLGREVFFHVKSHGYEHAADGFGFRGKPLKVEPGGKAQLEVRRTQIAERLYRVTGRGIFRDTLLLGEKAPVSSDRGPVSGQDSVQAVVHRNQVRLFWGDTSRLSYPLGNFRTTGAVLDHPVQGGREPGSSLDLRYVTRPDGFVKEMCPFEREVLIWIEGVASAPDASGADRLIARYMRMKSLGEMLEHGIAVFRDDGEEFEKGAVLPRGERRMPHGQSLRVEDASGDWIYFGNPFPNVRVRRKFEALIDPDAYEAWSCLRDGTDAPGDVGRGSDGTLAYRWTGAAQPIGAAEEQKLIADGRIREEEARLRPADIETGSLIRLQGGSVRWNAWRRRWILVAVESGGSSFLGEIWYAESREPTGPWRRARKVVTHDRYSFYNPVQHAFLDEEDGKRIYFEGTYTEQFSGAPQATPRYDYNQVMYRLDLEDTRLAGVRD